jgi:hypothetical protein
LAGMEAPSEHSSDDSQQPRRIIDLRTHPAPHVTASELALYWKVGVKQIYKHIEMRTLKGVRFGPRLFRIRTIDAIRFEHIVTMSPASDITPPRRRPKTRRVGANGAGAAAPANDRQ